MQEHYVNPCCFLSSFHILSSVVHTVNTKVRHTAVVSGGHLDEIKNNRRF